jgi:hypothetical protein
MEKKGARIMTRDQFLTEWLGECWHEVPDNGFKYQICKKCGAAILIVTGWQDFSTWPGFGKLWEAAQKDEEFERFLVEQEIVKDCSYEGWDGFTVSAYKLNLSFINPDRFAAAWAKFKGWKEK